MRPGGYAQLANAPASYTGEQVGGEYLGSVERLIKKERREKRRLFKAIKGLFANSPRVSTFAAAAPFSVPLLAEAEATLASQVFDQRRGKSAGEDYAQPTNAPASDTREDIGGDYLCHVEKLIKKEPQEERSLFKAIERAFATPPRESTFSAAGPASVPPLGEAQATLASEVIEPVNMPNLHRGTGEDSFFSRAHTFESQV